VSNHLNSEQPRRAKPDEERFGSLRSPHRFEQVQREELKRLFASFVSLRLLVIPIPVVLASWIFVSEPTAWRRACLVGALGSMVALSLFEARRVRRRESDPRAFALNFAVGVAVQTVVIAATGGAESPVVLTFPLVLMAVGLFGSRRLLRIVYFVQVATVWLFTAAAIAGVWPGLNPRLFGGGARGGHNDTHLFLTAFVFTMLSTIMALLAGKLRQAHDRVWQGLFAARDEALQAHADRAQMLTTMAGEIAHELKNPLASVKGLAALTAKDLDGKNAERMAVLRREVDRMQGILDEFLNFSRPLGPLSQERVELSELCAGVVALHEGVLGARHVSLDGAALVRCDPRKVKQIVINLLQNALEAAPDGDVTIEVRQNAAAAQVRVLDRGPGVAADVAARAFDAGVTTKRTGSGLGLTIARALARQHGGELILVARSGGGCAAELTIPVQS
jgi:signal transduction histidine kinase